MELNDIIRWIVISGLKLLAGAGSLLVAFRLGTSAIRDLVPQLMRAQAESLPSGTSSDGEIDKRIATIQDLLTKLLRVAVLALLVALVLAILDLWTVLTAIVIVIGALLFATQDVVLDYVMGFLILVEGPYFKGDWMRVGNPGGVEGTVEEIGLRRTQLRDGMGSLHAVSHGLIRQSTNTTRRTGCPSCTAAIPLMRTLTLIVP
jgi:small-conductance mechanosensitive channel